MCVRESVCGGESVWRECVCGESVCVRECGVVRVCVCVVCVRERRVW